MTSTFRSEGNDVMKECEWTERMEAALRLDAPGSEEQAHLMACAECRQLAEMARLLATEGRAAERSAVGRLPEAEEILSRARPSAAVEEVRRALRPIVWIERAAAVLGFFAGVVVGWWLLRRWNERVPFDRSSLGTSLTTSPTDVLSLGMLLAMSIVVGVALYGFLGPGGFTTRRG